MREELKIIWYKHLWNIREVDILTKLREKKINTEICGEDFKKL